jgi:hypothetical protein
LEVVVRLWLKWTGLILLAAAVGLEQAFEFTAEVWHHNLLGNFIDIKELEV